MTKYSFIKILFSINISLFKYFNIYVCCFEILNCLNSIEKSFELWFFRTGLWPLFHSVYKQYLNFGALKLFYEIDRPRCWVLGSLSPCDVVAGLSVAADRRGYLLLLVHLDKQAYFMRCRWKGGRHCYFKQWIHMCGI